MADRDIPALVTAIGTWQTRRVEESQAFTRTGFRGFVEVHNYFTRELIRILENTDPEFYSALAELAVNAQTLTTKGAKLRADHIDRTNL